MRAKRSKKYRKLMHQYELAFGFREPYQVLVDSNFLHAVHSFKMDLIPALERTLQGKVKPLLTKCSLAAIMASQPTNPRTNHPVRPAHLPPPTTLPLRHCSHNDSDAPIDETACLLSLLSPSAEVKRNKEHYILATADPPMPKGAAPAGGGAAAAAAGRKRKRGEAEVQAEAALRRAKTLRASARTIPGVPIVYVKRSVMILEPMSALSEGLREGYEMGKFRAGLTDETSKPAEGDNNKKKKAKKVKGPNPLSVKKPKKRVVEKPPSEKKNKDAGEGEGAEKAEGEGDDSAPKPKRRRRHHRSKPEGAGPGPGPGSEQAAPAEE